MSGITGSAPIIKSIQRGTISVPGTATISGVDTSKTVLMQLGYQGISPTDARYTNAYLTLTNSTTVTASGQGGTVAFQAVEYA